MKKEQNPSSRSFASLRGRQKISYEPEADVLRVEFNKRPIDYAAEVGNVVVHFSPENVPVYLEFLEASKFVSDISNIIRSARKSFQF